MTQPDHLALQISQHLRESAAIKEQLAANGVDAITVAAQRIAGSFRSGGKLLLCGNGGSAADCQHMAAELMHRLSKAVVRPGLPAIALTTDTSFITAFANDSGYDDVFARQVQALGRPGDVVLGISTSGNSRNVISAIETARSMGLYTIGLTGNVGGLAAIADHAVAVPSADTQYIQEAHLAIEHIICSLVEQTLGASGERSGIN